MAKKKHPPQAYILSQLDLYNWGPFSGRHHAEIDLAGTAIVGPTGSGKTTLVDAFMTLITAIPRYNLASTGGHESDRDLVSYVRGKTGEGNQSDNTHIARANKTLTAIAASFSNDKDKVTLAAIFWFDSSSSSTSDLKRLWLFNQNKNQELDDWLSLFHEEGARALKQLGKNTAGLRIWDNKKPYLAHIRRFFDVGENAFTLLNRAAGLKQLNSIDEIFRELVLDDHSAFVRAAEVADEFDDLASIHEELEIAKRQQQSLLPIKSEHGKYQQKISEQKQQLELKNLLPQWFAQQAHSLWQAELANQQGQLHEVMQASEALQQEIKQHEEQVDNLKTSYYASGGASIELLQSRISDKSRQLEQTRQHVQSYQQITEHLELDSHLSRTSFTNNQIHLEKREQAFTQQAEDQKQKRNSAIGEHEALRSQHQEKTQEEQAIRQRPGSNIPGHFQQFRSSLADELQLDEDQLPFVAELIEIKPEQQHWRGAIERAIGSHRLRILVPEAHMTSALRWVNQRHNRLHVRLLKAEHPHKPAHFLSDGFTHKLNFKPHAFREPLKHLLAGIDRHCVDSPEALDTTPHGLTAQGLMSGKQGYFEKQDQKRLDQDWMTGFDNKDRLAQIQADLQALNQSLKQTQLKVDEADRQHQQTLQSLQQIERLKSIEFETIDLHGITAEFNNLQQQLDNLTSPNSDAAKAREQWQQAEQVLKDLRDQYTESSNQAAVIQDRLAQAQAQLARLRLPKKPLTEVQQQLAKQHFVIPTAKQIHRLAELEKQAAQTLQQKLDQLSDSIRKSEANLVRFMSKAKSLDTGALSESGTELIDIPDYLQQLIVLTEEALPKKLERFLNYLNQSSDQGVTQLLSHIENEVSVIEERIQDLNDTMRLVDFQPQHYLRLDPKRVVHQSLTTLNKAQAHLRSARLKEDEGESHYKALKQVIDLIRDAVERKKTQGAKALLDPRYRLQFAVSVINREQEQLIETRTGSQGGSGGEKEIIASYILTASLSYALCPNDAKHPLFGSIVLDEAFSKSSQAVAGRIISALREFGLHPLFVTPNKEMRLLRTHTRSAILIHRKGAFATMTSLSWQELADKAQQVRLQRKEPD